MFLINRSVATTGLTSATRIMLTGVLGLKLKKIVFVTHSFDTVILLT